MTKLKVTWHRPRLGERTGWARTCIALAGGRGARAIVGEYLTEGEQLIESGTLIVRVEPTAPLWHGGEVATIWRVMSDYGCAMRPEFASPPRSGIGELYQATAQTYDWRTEHVSLREKLAELLAADRDGADIGDGTEHEREYLTELERVRHYLRRTYDALAELDNMNSHIMLDHTLDVRLGDVISGPLAAVRKAYPELCK